MTLLADDGYIHQTISVTAGKWYHCSFYYKNTAGDTATFGFYDETNGAWIMADEMEQLDSQTSFYKFSRSFLVPSGCSEVSVRLGGLSNGDIVWFDEVSVKEVDETASTTWEDILIASRKWLEIFELPTAPQVEMTLLYGDTSPPTSSVGRLEILSAIATGRYFQVQIDITDPSDQVNALVEDFTIKYCQLAA